VDDEENPERPDPRFSFLKETEHMPSEDLDYWMHRVLMKTGWKRDHPFIRALFRGIGIHHPALKMNFRQLVETMFRGKHLKIVISTETLAMGINMPCRSVCFAGDYRLTPLLYQQMAGRAGRRGFDDVGHVVFFGVPPRKAFRLVKSPLAHLEGYFPVNTNLVLRIMQHYSGAKNKKWALETFRTLITHPFNASLCTSQQKRVLLQQARFHFRFSLHFLYEKGLLDSKGNVKGMANLLNHMSADTAAVYPFVTLLESGVLERMCANFNRDKTEVSKNVMSVLAHFFERIPLPANFDAELMRKVDRKDTSQIILPPLPAEIQAIVDQHNRTTVDCFSTYVRVFCNYLAENDPSFARSNTRLPLSNLQFPPHRTAQAHETEPGTVIEQLWTEAKTISSVARSSFIGLSGATDEFHSLEEISDTIHATLGFPTHVEPVVATRDLLFHEKRLNAYAIDVFSHKKVYKLMSVNNLDDKTSFTVLKNWAILMQQLMLDTETLMGLQEVPNKPPIYQCFKFIMETFQELVGQLIKLGLQHGEVY
jgi:hypothetical protein